MTNDQLAESIRAKWDAGTGDPCRLNDAEVCAILAMLERGDGLPWKVIIPNHCIGAGKVLAATSSREHAYAFSPEYYHGQVTITGPDDEKPESERWRRAMQMMEEPAPNPGTTAPSEGTPCVTFKPWVQKDYVRLRDASPNTPHRCEAPDGLAVYAMHDGEKVYSVYSGGDRGSQIGRVNEEAWFALDVKPPAPKTLADVPDDVVCVSGGSIVSRVGSSVYMIAGGRIGRYSGLPDKIPITRVLGTPVFHLGGSDE